MSAKIGRISIKSKFAYMFIYFDKNTIYYTNIIRMSDKNKH